jgi:hypothetical protein
VSGDWWRGRWVLPVGILALLAYVVLAIVWLPQWVVSWTAGQADVNTQLNAVTNTRGALLSLMVPVVIVLGGVAALLNYQEGREQNQRANDLARAERDETRRMHHAQLYAELLGACHGCLQAATDLYNADRNDPGYLSTLRVNAEKRAAMDLSADRVMLFGSNAVQAAARDLNRHCGAEIATKANSTPRPSDDEWRRITVTDYAPIYRAFIDAARADLTPAP